MKRAQLVATLLCGAVHALGQSTGAITGIVTDSQSSAIPGAAVTVLNANTNLRQQVKTNDYGLYAFPALPVGEYSVTAEMDGFRTLTREGVRVQVNQKLTADFVLPVSTVKEQVVVEARAALMETTTSTLSQVVDTRQVNDLPLNGRNVLQLIGLDAGVSTRGGSLSYANPYVYPTGGGYVVDNTINGARGNQTDYRLDGGNNTHGNFGIANPFPNPDAVQEFTAQTNSFSAQYGGVGGGVINVVTKSGTNELHGSLWEFNRNQDFNAKNFFAPTADTLKRNQFGVAAGGPVFFPSVYNGKDRTFFFGSYQGTRNRRAQSGALTTALTGAQKQGDLSGTAVATDPLTGKPFPGNIIPSDRFDPAIGKLLDYMPAANRPGNVYSFGQPSQIADDDQYVVRLDQLFRGGHQLTGRYTLVDFRNPSSYLPKNLYSVTSGFESLAHNAMLSYTRLLAPKLINVVRFTFTRTTLNVVTGLDLAAADLGAHVPKTNPGNISISLAGFSGLNTGFWNRHYNQNYEYADDANYNVGRHSVKFGFSLLKDEIRSAGNFNSSGSYSFNGQISGNVLADFLLGTPSTFSMRQIADKSTSTYRPAAYVQDDLRLTQHLTVNLGLRWDVNRPYVDSIDSWPAFRPGVQSQRFVNAPIGLVFSNDAGVPRGVGATDWTNFGPRLGFAWNPKGGKTVIRGGYGIFYDHLWAQSGWRFSEPYAAQTTLFAPPSFTNPYGSGPPQNPSPIINPPRDVAFSPFLSFGSMAPDFHSGFVQSGNLTLERRLTQDLIIRTSYVGTFATQLMTSEAINPAIYLPGVSTVANTNARRIYPTLGSITEIRNGARSWYHSWQLGLQKRMGRYLTFTSNYTLSKSIDTSSYAQDGGVTEGPNPFNRRLNRALSDFDTTHNFSNSVLWALPTLKDSSPLVRAVAGGWQIDGIIRVQSGFPFSVTDNRDLGLAGIGSGVRADLAGNPYLPASRSRGERVAKYFNTGAFAPAGPGTFGASGRNILRGPGFVNVDSSLLKNFRVQERWALQFRSEFFNLLNRPNFGQPNSLLTSPVFGRILTAADPRILQLGLKVIF